MASNVHSTMRGVGIDLDQLIIANEKTVAIGNMKVNAGGDELGPGGIITKTHSERVKEANALHSMVPDNTPIATGTGTPTTTKAVEPDVVSENTNPKPARKKRAPRKNT